MSGTFPTSPAFQELGVRSFQDTFVSRTISGRRQTRQIGGQYWLMRAVFPPMTRAQFAPIHAFVLAQRGRYESFTIIPPVLSTGLGSPAGTPLVNGASQTGRSIITDGWAVSNGVAIFKAGDYLKFANHDKVYIVTTDEISDGSGTATIAIEPALVTSPANDSAITHSNVPFTVALTSGVQEFTTNTTGLFGFEIDFEEVL